MTRFKNLLVAAFAVAIVAIVAGAVPAAAQESCGSGCSAHYVGAGSSAQFIMAAIAADQAAIEAQAAEGSGSICHWSKKSAITSGTQTHGAYLTDNRDTLGRIANEPGNIWAVWIENGACGSGTSVSDLWLDVSVDSTVGVRCFSAVQQNMTQGCGVVDVDAASTASDAIISNNSTQFWPDGNLDVSIDAIAVAAINAGLNINVGLTDIRPEDALFATERAIGTLNTTTYAGLGYVGPTGNIGAPIYTDQGVLQGTGSTGTTANPVKFALAGKEDPFFSGTAHEVSSYTTYPIGAAPVVFIMNNNAAVSYPTNLVSGVTPGVANTAPGAYALAHLFDGTTSCDTDNAAFGGNNDGLGTALTVFLREPLSGTMNTTEFNLFRSTGNTNDSQEKGITNPTRSPYNPLQLNCTGKGLRSRAIGTGEVVGKSGAYGVLDTANSLGYIFTGWGNLSKFGGSAKYNYLTLDGVDPLFDSPTSYSVCVNNSTSVSNGQVCGANEACASGYTCTAGANAAQTIPECTTASCSSDLWGADGTYPGIRKGTYKAWSIYRWIANPTNTDPYGPALVQQEAQNYVDSGVADFVPFSACAPGAGSSCLSSHPTDGLSVYRSHFVPKGVTGVTANNGSATVAAVNGANTLGGGTEAGGDVGGLVQGPFGITVADSTGTVVTSGTNTAHKGYKVTWKSGAKFTAGTSWEGQTITINGSPYTIANVALTATVLYVTSDPGANTTAVAYSVPVPYTYPAATTPGTLNKHQ
jgi:hypothetical protein